MLTRMKRQNSFKYEIGRGKQIHAANSCGLFVKKELQREKLFTLDFCQNEFINFCHFVFREYP